MKLRCDAAAEVAKLTKDDILANSARSLAYALRTLATIIEVNTFVQAASTAYI